MAMAMAMAKAKAMAIRGNGARSLVIGRWIGGENLLVRNVSGNGVPPARRAMCAEDRGVPPRKSQDAAAIAAPAPLDHGNALESHRIPAIELGGVYPVLIRKPAAATATKAGLGGCLPFTPATGGVILHAPRLEGSGAATHRSRQIWTSAREKLGFWWAMRFDATEEPPWRRFEVMNTGVSTRQMLLDIFTSLECSTTLTCAAHPNDRFVKQFKEAGRVISEEMILEMHKSACENHKPELGQPGCMRNEEVGTITASGKQMYYLSHLLVPEELRKLIAHVNFLLQNVEPSNIYGMFKVASIFYARFGWIHPFGDKNGKVAILLVSVILRDSLGFYIRWPDPWPEDHHRRISPQHSILLWCLEETGFATKYPSELCAWMIEAAWIDCNLNHKGDCKLNHKGD